MVTEIKSKEYFDEIKPHLRDIINKLKISQTWKIQLTITINNW